MISRKQLMNAAVWLGVVLTMTGAPTNAARSRQLTQADKPGGEFRTVPGLAPVAGVETIQIPGTNSFLITDFLDGSVPAMQPHPSSNANGHNMLQVWNRDSNTWTNIPIDRNPSCGGWHTLPNGNIGMFAGHAGTQVQNAGLGSIYVYDTTMRTADYQGPLTTNRWYPAVLGLPDGKTLIMGGTMTVGGWDQSPGNDLWDATTKTTEQVPRPVSMGAGNFYQGSWVLPTGDLIIMDHGNWGTYAYNHLTGEIKARAPGLPDVVSNVIWEFPHQGAPIMLRTPVLRASTAVRLEFVVFGGSTAPFRNDKVASKYSVRIGLNIAADGSMAFDPAWETEEMPRPRAVLDTMVLPNGHVLIMNGGEIGYGGLLAPSQAMHNPVSEVWIYKPEAPAGSRYTQTGVRSRIARLYHGTALLTLNGDAFIAGCSNCGNFTSPNMADWDLPTIGISEYRTEIYRPPYILRPGRPVITGSPRTVGYGKGFQVSVNSGAGAITAVVLTRPGSPTHSYTMDTRSQLLEFTLRTAGVLRVMSPQDSNCAPPGFYFLFLLAGEAYSAGVWIQITPQPPAVPLTLPRESVFLSGVGPLSAYGVDVASGANATIIVSGRVTSAAVRIQGTSPRSVWIADTDIQLQAGRRYHPQIWAVASRTCTATMVWFAPDGAAAPFGTHAIPLSRRLQLLNLPTFYPQATGSYRFEIQVGLCNLTNVRVADMDIWSSVPPPSPPPPPPRQITKFDAVSSDFETPTLFGIGRFDGAWATWEPQSTDGGDNSTYAGKATVTTTSPTGAMWHLQVFSPTIRLSAGTQIITRVSLRCTTRYTVFYTWLTANGGQPEEVYGSQMSITATPFWNSHEAPPFTVPATGTYNFNFNFGTLANGNSVFIDNVEVYALGTFQAAA